MDKETRKLKKELKVPWITKDGYLDLGKIPIDGILEQTLSKDFDKFRSGCGILQSMHNHERIEAGIYGVSKRQPVQMHYFQSYRG
ncbi:MAG: hypothetical protein JRF08_07790 [Deltaproteobacteria bacterium]|nr:hypothetical protein [Deltaproteobacteria bacterium]